MPLRDGKIVAQVNVRDTLTTSYQSQLDEVARGLISRFSESDQSGASLPDATGLFSYTGSPAVPLAGTVYPGLASEIRISAAFDPTQGGTASLLRDGGATVRPMSTTRRVQAAIRRACRPLFQDSTLQTPSIPQRALIPMPT